MSLKSAGRYAFIGLLAFLLYNPLVTFLIWAGVRLAGVPSVYYITGLNYDCYYVGTHNDWHTALAFFFFYYGPSAFAIVFFGIGYLLSRKQVPYRSARFILATALLLAPLFSILLWPVGWIAHFDKIRWAFKNSPPFVTATVLTPVLALVGLWRVIVITPKTERFWLLSIAAAGYIVVLIVWSNGIPLAGRWFLHWRHLKPV